MAKPHQGFYRNFTAYLKRTTAVMNKKILLLIMLISISSWATAQTKAFQFGFKVAPNIGWVKPDAQGYERIGTKAGFNWGFQGEFFLMENYFLNTGFNVIYLNGDYSYPHKQLINDEAVEGIQERLLKMQYLQIPLILKMKTNEFNGIKIYGQVGFGLGFTLNAKADDVFIPNPDQSTIGRQEEENRDVKNEYRSTRESLLIGAGIEIPLGGSTYITAGLLFDNGFRDIIKDQNAIDSSIAKSGITNFIELQISLLF